MSGKIKRKFFSSPIGDLSLLAGDDGGIERKRWLLEHENAIFRKEEE